MTLKRTSLMLDTELVDRAAAILGTARPTDTVRGALERTVRDAHIANLIAWELPDDAMETLGKVRAPREFR